MPLCVGGPYVCSIFVFVIYVYIRVSCKRHLQVGLVGNETCLVYRITQDNSWVKPPFFAFLLLSLLHHPFAPAQTLVCGENGDDTRVLEQALGVTEEVGRAQDSGPAVRREREREDASIDNQINADKGHTSSSTALPPEVGFGGDQVFWYNEPREKINLA